MRDDAEARLLAIAEAIADGFEVDWVALRDREPRIAEELEQMRTVETVRRAYSIVRDERRSNRPR